MTHDAALVERSPARPVTAPRRRRRVLLVVSALITALTLAGFGWLNTTTDGSDPDVTTFGVWDHERERLVYERELALGERFVLEHTHSVTRRTVSETFSLADVTTLAIEELRYDAFGPNLPTGPEVIGDRTTTFLEEDGVYRVIHDSFPLGSVPLLVGSPSVDHILIFSDGERVRLLDVARSQQRVELFAGGGRP